ncbi:Vacuolar iron transporter 1 [Heracleum sosnowskyi]|uniref:Vacuolar iron transporter n=1 Tax=Heracleum sosnowskyi TaxID=360622 RepID=A0AAD8MHI6_9APIA|nr:Vacuolar iron transporter 1 [Heracleum sosnowskyi]
MDQISNDDGATSNATPLLRSVVVTNGAEDIQNEEEQRRPTEPWQGEFAKSIIYAGLDAIVTSFSLISSISAGRLSSVDVLVLGFANLVADGISMGFGDFVSSSTEKDVAAKERLVVEWEVTNHRTPQKRDLLRQYQALGMAEEDASAVVNLLAKYKNILVDEKMSTEKRILPPDESEKPWKNGLVTFVAFLVFGSAPLLGFIILMPFTNNDTHKFIGACIMSAIALVLLGIAKAKIAGQSYIPSAILTLLNGAIAGGVAYLIGWTLKNVAGLED